MSNMKLCKVCSKEIAKSAKICPNCGAKQDTALKKLLIGICIIIGIIVCVAALTSGGSNSNSSSSSSNNSNSSVPKDWNKSETDIQKNGNIDYAVNLIKQDSDVKSKAKAIDAASIIKAPFQYYGQVIQEAGFINDIEEYAQGSDWSKSLGGGEAGQIVITTEDGTAIDMFVVGSTGNLKKGDYVTLYGYPVGLTDNENSLGGKNTELAIVGNSYDKASESTN